MPTASMASLEPLRADKIVRGTVIDRSGAAIPRAQVWLVMGYGISSIVGPSETDNTGNFEVHSVMRYGHPASIYVRATGFGPTELHDIDPRQPSVSVGGIVVIPAARIEGRVTNLRGDPVPNAQIFTSHNLKWVCDPEIMKPPRCADAVSDEFGNYVIDGLPAGIVTVGCAAPQFADFVEETPCLEPGTNRVDIHLGPALVVRGQVEDSTGRPIGNAFVTPSKPLHLRSYWRAEARTDANGNFELNYLSNGREKPSIQIEAPGYQVANIAPGDLEAGKPIILTPTTTVRMSVRRDGTDELPTIDLVAQYSETFEGNFRLDSSEPGKCSGTVSWSDEPGTEVELLVFSTDRGVAPKVTFKLPSPLATELRFDVIIPAFGEIVGSVIQPNGEPIVCARVELRASRGRAPRVEVTDARGRFRFTRVNPDRGFLCCRSKDWVSDPLEVKVLAGETTNLGSIRARAGAGLVGKVTIDGRAPGRPISVAAYSFTPRTNTWDLYAAACVSTDQDGHFAIYGLSQGRCAIAVRPDALEPVPAISTFRMPYPWSPSGGSDNDWQSHWPWVVDIVEGEASKLDLDVVSERTRSTGGK
jgi:hypothetical protein